MTRLQRWILWLLRQSHRWERLAGLFIGRARYQGLKDWGWQLYIRESLRRTGGPLTIDNRGSARRQLARENPGGLAVLLSLDKKTPRT